MKTEYEHAFEKVGYITAPDGAKIPVYAPKREDGDGINSPEGWNKLVERLEAMR